MKHITLFLFVVFATFMSFCQTTKDHSKFNFDFEQVEKNYPINWENSGLGDNSFLDSTITKSGKYSAVLNHEGTSADFKVLYYVIPGSYEGKKISLSAWIRTKNVIDSTAGLFIRIDPEIAFVSMKEIGNSIIGSSNWKKYEVSLDLDPLKTKQILIGMGLDVRGEVWIDDLQVTIDGKDINDLEPIPPKKYPADKDSTFDYGSAILPVPLNKSKTEDLVALGKVWGFLKYYHSAIAAGNYNWDYELFRVLPKILQAKDKAERNSILSAWVQSYGKVEPGNEEKIIDEIKMKPDLEWINVFGLGKTLTSELTKIKYAKRSGENYYVELLEIGCPDFLHERPYLNLKYPDAGFQLLSLYRYWNIIQYYFPYKYLIGENWNTVLKEFVPKFMNATNEPEYGQAVLQLISRINDTHANLWGSYALENYFGLNYAPVKISFIENKAVVTGYFDQVLGERTGLKIGDVIETVNNKSVSKIIKEKLPFTPASNYACKLRKIALDVLRTNDSLISIEYKRGDVKFSGQIRSYTTSEIDFMGNYYRKDTCFRLINSNISYLSATLKNEDVRRFMPEVLKTKGLIIDLRYPSLEFVIFSLGEYLVPDEKSFAKISKGSIITPGLFTIKDTISVGKKNDNYYKGKVVIIVNEESQSLREYMAMAFETAPKATIIGSTTAGADGNVAYIALPGGISTMISSIGEYYPDGRETQRIGIIPDIVVRPTIKGTREGRDELLEKAIEIINSK